MLEESGLVQRAAYLIGIVNRDRPTIRSQLLNTSFHFQQVLDVQWRVDHSVRTKYQDQIGEPTFLISIITAGGEGVRVHAYLLPRHRPTHMRICLYLEARSAPLTPCARSLTAAPCPSVVQVESGARREVKFACSREELQDLVAKLKDACTQVDRILGTSRK